MGGLELDTWCFLKNSTTNIITTIPTEPPHVPAIIGTVDPTDDAVVTVEEIAVVPVVADIFDG